MATASSLMTKDVIRITADKPIYAADVLLRNRLSALSVFDATGHLVGIASEGDLARCAKKQRDAHRSWWLGLLTKAKSQIKRVPIVTHGRLVGPAGPSVHIYGHLEEQISYLTP